MRRRAAITFAGALLGLALWTMTAFSQGNNDKEAQEAILKLVESMRGNKGDIKAQTAAIKKKFDELEPLMWVYKPRKKGGLGIGKDGDGIELTISKVGNPRAKGWTSKKRLDMRGELAKIAELSRAIAEVTDLYPNKYKEIKKGKPNPALWKKYVEQMRKGADELGKAAKGQDAAAIQKAAANLESSCTNCHSDFH